MQNLVSSCVWHNQWKKNRILEAEKLVIEGRSKEYFSKGVDVTVGELKPENDSIKSLKDDK